MDRPAKNPNRPAGGATPDGDSGDADVYGTIVITPFEALAGTQKVVTVPGIHSRRLIRVTVPPDVREGTVCACAA